MNPGTTGSVATLYPPEVGGSSSGLLPVKLDCARVPTRLYRIQMTQSREGCPIPFSIVSKRPREEESTDAKTTSCLFNAFTQVFTVRVDRQEPKEFGGRKALCHTFHGS